MEDTFLRAPDHFTVDHALRRAGVLALGGAPELADVVLTTGLVENFNDPDLWRAALRSLASCGDFTRSGPSPSDHRLPSRELRDIDLRRRTFASPQSTFAF